MASAKERPEHFVVLWKFKTVRAFTLGSRREDRRTKRSGELKTQPRPELLDSDVTKKSYGAVTRSAISQF